MPSWLIDKGLEYTQQGVTAVGEGAADLARSLRGASTNIPDSSLTQSKYDFQNLIFPEDLGNEDNGHYIVFNINVPVKSDTDPSIRSALQTGDEVLPGDYSKVDVLRFGGFPGYGGRSAQLAALPRGTRRIARSIAMYVPSQMTWDTSHEWSDISLTALGGDIMTGVARGVGGFVGGLANMATGGMVGTVAGALGSAASGIVNNIPRVSQVAGKPINPLKEVLFSHTHLREFIFEFLMVPRNAREAAAIKAIIANFRYWSAPEIDTAMPLFFIPPAEFDITLYNRGEENTHVPRFNTSVLTRLMVNYIPFNDSYTTYTDGHPVGTLMTLQFTELEVLHKQRVLQGF